MRDLLSRIAGAFSSVPGTTPGTSWALRMQAELAGTDDVPPPAPREHWRSRALKAGGVESFGLPLLNEILGCLGADAPGASKAKKIFSAVRAAEGETAAGRYAVALALARADVDLRRQIERGSSGDDHRHLALCAAYDVAITAAMLATCSADEPGEIRIPAIVQSGLAELRVLGSARDILERAVVALEQRSMDRLEVVHALGLVQSTYGTSAQCDLGGNVDGSALPDIISPDAVVVADYGCSWTAAALALGEPCAVSNRTQALEALTQAMMRGYALQTSLTQGMTAAMPNPSMPSWESREEILAHQVFALWPGTTRVEWQEAGLRGLSLHQGAGAGVLFSVQTDARVPWIPESTVPLQLIGDIPPMGMENAWTWARQNAEDEEHDILGIPMEALRMCLVPKERKIIAGSRRAPAGYVRGPRAPRSGEVAVTFVPRVQRVGEYPIRSEGHVPAIQRSPVHAHHVAPHIRQIPMDWKASQSARAEASVAGIDLPERGFTFVRGHVRGEGDAGGVVTVRVRGGA